MIRVCVPSDLPAGEATRVRAHVIYVDAPAHAADAVDVAWDTEPAGFPVRQGVA